MKENIAYNIFDRLIEIYKNHQSLDIFLLELGQLYRKEPTDSYYHTILKIIPELVGFLPGPETISSLIRQLSLVNSVYMYEQKEEKLNWGSKNLVVYTLLYHAIRISHGVEHSTLSSGEVSDSVTQSTMNLSNTEMFDRFSLKLPHLLQLENPSNLIKFESNLRKLKDKTLDQAMTEFASKKKLLLLVIYVQKNSLDNSYFIRGDIDPATHFFEKVRACRASASAQAPPA